MVGPTLGPGGSGERFGPAAVAAHNLLSDGPGRQLPVSAPALWPPPQSGSAPVESGAAYRKWAHILQRIGARVLSRVLWAARAERADLKV